MIVKTAASELLNVMIRLGAAVYYSEIHATECVID